MRARLLAVLTSLLAVALMVGTASTAAAHPPPPDQEPQRAQKREQLASGVNIPVLSSPNVRLVNSFPDTLGISGVFATSAPLFILSTTTGISVFDVTDPMAPRLTGVLPLAHFENEAINYGERRGPGGAIERFVMVGYDLFGVPAGTDPDHVGTSREVAIVDVTNPTTPRVRSTARTTTSTHTVSCIRDTACDFAYSAGTAGTFSVLDLTDLDAPREVDGDPTAPGVQPFASPAAGPNAVFTRGAGHKWNFDGAGYGIHTGSGGSAIFDVRDPAAPSLVTTTDENGTSTPWNDFIHHNSDRPNASRFAPDTPPSVAAGNVLLITEEDYENTDCATAGSFQSWYVERLDGTPAAVHPLDRINPVSVGEGAALPQMTFCSAHWFDVHPSGIVAQGFYQGGVRFTDVRDATDLTEYGYFATGVSEVWDTYWVPRRNIRGIATGDKTNLVYVVDLIRGLEVLEVDLPR
ncbi:MAG TPA: hypothetical protein DEQ61_04880 [Streptomyces sp.]|nr:hypothetical protein [Streptomyces sp.]